MLWLVNKRLLLVLLALTGVCAAVAVFFSQKNYATEYNNPDLVLDQFLAYVSEGDIPSAIEMTGARTDLSSDFSGKAGSDSMSDLSGVEERLLWHTFHHVSVRHRSGMKVSGRDAWAELTLVYPDTRLVMRNAVEGALQETADDEWKHGSYANDEEILAAVKDALPRHLGDNAEKTMITEKVRVGFRFRDGQWRLRMSDDLYRALTGNLSGAAESADEIFREIKDKVPGKRGE